MALTYDQLLTADEYERFVEGRPDEERWELIDGVAILNPSPSYLHQLIVGNISAFLHRLAEETDAPWVSLPGLGLRIGGIPASTPQPDVVVRPALLSRSPYCDDAIVLFEVLSPGSKRRDLRRKPELYAKVPSVSQYVVVAQDQVRLVSFRKEEGWSPREIADPAGELAVPALGAMLPMQQIYRRTGLVPEG